MGKFGDQGILTFQEENILILLVMAIYFLTTNVGPFISMSG
jgi:hypothetical protein